MSKGLWPAVSGAIARTNEIDAIANNVANIDTLGFKKDRVSFKEYLSSLEKPSDTVDVPRGPFKDKDFYPLDGRDQSFVVTYGTHTDFSQGHLKVTQRPLDVALQGPGFFEVSTPRGIRYTKQGSFKRAKDGLLVTSQGYPVLSLQNQRGLATAQPTPAVQSGQGGQSTQGGVATEQNQNVQPPPPEVVARYIRLPDGGPKISISENGEIYWGENQVAKLEVTEFVQPKTLQKEANLLFVNSDTNNYKPNSSETIVHQGVLEGSNVNPAEEMTKLIQAQRMYELSLKSIKTQDQMMDKEVNELGRGH